jgi:uncharacterized protein involved in exopolysaccharide biosynthesis
MTSEVGIHKVRGVVRRRTLAVVATALGVGGVAAVLLWQIPPTYRAQAVIRVLEAQPAKEYVAPTVAEQIGERLKSLRLGVMARPVVADAAAQLDLFRLSPARTHEEVVDALRERMDVKVEGDDTFLLTYSDSDPERARALTNRVADLFMKQQVARREQIASATVDALRADVEAVRPEMDHAAQVVREVKLKHYGALPEQQEGNLRTLDETTMEINIQATNLDVELEHRRQLLASALSPLRHQEETLAGFLYEARTKYTDEHPEVERIRAEYEQVKRERINDERDLSQKLRAANPELAALEREIARSRALLGGLRGRQAEVRRRVDETAKNAEELAHITAAFEMLRDKYHGTSQRLRDAELALELERNLAGLRFDLVEGASLPHRAGAPDRPLLGFAAALLALSLGLGVGFLLDAQDHTVRGSADLTDLGPLPPILATVPRTSAGKHSRHEKPEA